MGLRRGLPQILIGAQIRQVLAWHRAWQRFRGHHESARRLAARLGVSQSVIYYCIERYRVEHHGPAQSSSTAARPGARRGRPASLSDMKLAIVLAWHVRYLKFVERTGTAHTIARRMGVSEGTIYDCIRRRGRYTHLSTSCSNHMSRARRFQGDEAEIQARALLLKKWRRGPSLPAR